MESRRSPGAQAKESHQSPSPTAPPTWASLAERSRSAAHAPEPPTRRKPSTSCPAWRQRVRKAAHPGEIDQAIGENRRRRSQGSRPYTPKTHTAIPVRAAGIRSRLARPSAASGLHPPVHRPNHSTAACRGSTNARDAPRGDLRGQSARRRRADDGAFQPGVGIAPGEAILPRASSHAYSSSHGKPPFARCPFDSAARACRSYCSRSFGRARMFLRQNVSWRRIGSSAELASMVRPSRSSMRRAASRQAFVTRPRLTLGRRAMPGRLRSQP